MDPAIITGCVICRGGSWGQTIDGWLQQGIQPTEIERRLAGTPKPNGGTKLGVSRITISKHKNNHLTSDIQRERQKIVAEQKRRQKSLKPVSPRQGLEAIAAIGMERIESGEVEVSVDQTIKSFVALDNMDQKGADRDLTITIAAILGGSFRPQVAEGEYRVLDDVDPEVADEVRLLTAG